MHTRQRALILAMTVGLGLSLVLYTRIAAWGAAPNFIAMAIVGFMLFGPDALISAGTASGIINGIGSLGAIARARSPRWAPLEPRRAVV